MSRRPPRRGIARVRADNWIEKSIIRSAKYTTCIILLCPRKPIGRVHWLQRVMSCSAVNRAAGSSISSEKKKMTETVLANALLTEYNIHKNDRHYRNEKKKIWTKTKQKRRTFYIERSRFDPHRDDNNNIILHIGFVSKIQFNVIIYFTTCRLDGYQYTTGVCYTAYRGIVVK